jgi:small subunit ribosomal protein S8e
MTVMAILQLRSNRKATGGRYKRPKVRRHHRMGSVPILSKLGTSKKKSLRVIGGNQKEKILSADKVNIYNPQTKKHQVVAIKSVASNTANRHFVRRNILTKGSVIETELGQAKITSRPGQNNVINAVLV